MPLLVLPASLARRVDPEEGTRTLPPTWSPHLAAEELRPNPARPLLGAPDGMISPIGELLRNPWRTARMIWVSSR